MTRPDPRVHVDSDGVKSVESPASRSVWLIAGALIGLAIVFLALRPRNTPPPADLPGGSQTQAAAGVAAPAAQPPRFKPVRRPERPLDAPPADPPASADQAPRDVIEPAADDEAAAAEDGDDTGPTGIALFPPPGTDPPKGGLIVPDEFPLPPGYVRHYQSTDDGKRLPAILMFHPDYEWVDENGEAIAVPEDGVVPPELAPDGMPLQRLEIPETTIPLIDEPGAGDTATD